MTHAERLERRKAIADAASAGATYPELCQRFGVEYTTVYYVCKAYGVSPTKSDDSRHRRFECDPFKVLAKLLAPDEPVDAQVAQECGLSRERVRQIKERARAFGLLNTPRRRGRPKARAGKGQ